ncbi:MAG: hypothetical protein ACOY0T_07930 [Myxococcota bacterium]
MRWCVALALISTLLSSNALAADKGGKKNKKDKKAEAAGASMETTGADPAKTEKSDSGPYAPKGATGSLAEKEKETEEVEQAVKARPRDKKLLFADIVVGFGNSPKPGPNRATSDGGKDNQLRDSISGSLILGGNFDLSRTFTLGFRLPVGTSAIDTPSGKKTHFALGAIEVLGEYRHYLSPLTSLPVLFGVGIPTAGGDPDVSTGDNENRTNMIIDSSRGWRDGELFWPKRVPVILGVGIRHEGRSLELHAATKFVAGVRIAGDVLNANYYGSPNSGLVNNGVAMRSVTDVGLSYSFSEKFWAGADVWMVANIIEPQEFESDATPPSPFQFVGEPRVGMRFGKIRPSLGFLVPLGGRLAEAGMYGAHLRVDVAL